MGKKCFSCIFELDENKLYICQKCSNNKIYKTEIYKKYKINEDELINLPYGNTTYKNNICTYYYKPHIINILISKYGLDYETLLEQNKINNNLTKKQNKINKQTIRENKIKSFCYLNFIDYNLIKDLQKNQSYIVNGKNYNECVHFIKEYFTKYKILDYYLTKYNLTKDNNYCNKYLYTQSKYYSNIYNLIYKLIDMKKNKFILNIKLFLNNLEYRSDSVLYSDFIDGKNKYSIDKIISIMKEMDFLYNYTNYSIILKNERNKHIQNQRMYGWYEHDDYEEEKIRNRAKKIVLSKIKNLPDFSIVY